MPAPTTFIRAACVAALSFAAAPASADTGVGYINWSDKDRLVVMSNGEAYTKLDKPTEPALILSGRLEFDTNTVGRIKSWNAWPHIRTGYGTDRNIDGLKAYKVSKSYGVGSRPTAIDVPVEFFVPYSKFEQLAVSMCNQKADALRGQGKSDNDIFGKHQEVSFKISLKYSVDSNGAGSNDQIWEYYPDYVLPVRCAKWTGAQVPQGGNGDVAEAVRIHAATLKLEEQTTANGVCRVKTATALRANRAGATIKYRFVHSSGKKSPVFKIKTEANKIAVISRTWDVPNEDGPETGWFRVEGVGVSFKTAKVPYYMKCPGKAPGGLTFSN